MLQGGADAQVYPDKDYPAWRPVLDGKQADYRLFDLTRASFGDVAS